MIRCAQRTVQVGSLAAFTAAGRTGIPKVFDNAVITLYYYLPVCAVVDSLLGLIIINYILQLAKPVALAGSLEH